ncbi:hypothetical protein ACFO25_19560 [Paenactinomyces guangxiensis]|uniref:Uncharacterized protein n=1 Tax=Paenactinomyces guangxiensis TaxID=1490290 RepID=A0A7W1WUY1_9BACL|nr:hypothetical protein [Paenactinomyces guangxiensis]MBA4496521.1 hypothetical protein [Paenactinomyces guangxiensis]MBH8593553.1 hypothetical protein [Paenactinomyces guangxiensis]
MIPEEYEREWREVEAKAKAQFIKENKPLIPSGFWLLCGLFFLVWYVVGIYDQNNVERANLIKYVKEQTNSYPK